MTDISFLWTEIERAAWRLPEKITVSEWAGRYRILPATHSAEPGPWISERAPYTNEIMDAFSDPLIERITVVASAQSGKSEAAYNMLGYAMDQDPGPALIVLSTDATTKKVSARIRQMVEESPALKKELTQNPDDIKQKEFTTRRMIAWFATAGSSADLRNVSARYLILDETDDYPAAVGDQGSPYEMAEARTTTWWNRKIIQLCTPSTERGYIWTQYQLSDKRRFWVPCPECGGYQTLKFAQIKHRGAELGAWPKDKRDPGYIVANRAACYQCQYCTREIDDFEKPAMLRRGSWVPEDHPIDRKTGAVAFPRPVNPHAGFCWSALYSPWRTFSEIAAKFFAVAGDREALQAFTNLWLAEPWKETAYTANTAEILELKTDLEPNIVPAGALGLTAGVDVQKAGFWFVIRAWFREGWSHLIRYGFVETWPELDQQLFGVSYSGEAGDLVYPVWRIGIDTGGGTGDDDDATMTEQVYSWLRRVGFQGQVYGVKGISRPLVAGRRMMATVIDKYPGRSGRRIPGGVILWRLDTSSIKDAIVARIEAGTFKLHAETDEIYARHLVSEEKVLDKRGRFVWMIKHRQPNHLLDAEVYAAAMADPECDGGVYVLPDPGGYEKTFNRGSLKKSKRRESRW